MKKLRKIVSLLLAAVMFFGVFSVVGAAYAPYKGSNPDALVQPSHYDDVDSPDLNLNQFASMALDELDRMLAKEKIVLDVKIGVLDLSSVDGTIDSIKEFFANIQSLMSLVGDVGELQTAFNLSLNPGGQPIKRAKNNGNTAENQDLVVCEALFDFIARLNVLLKKYANGQLNLGILDSFVSDYLFNMRQLVVGLVFGAFRSSRKMKPKYDFFDDDGGENFLTPAERGGRLPDKYKNVNNQEDGLRDDAISYVLQDYVYDEIYGEWKKLNKYFEKADQNYTEDDVTKNYKYTEVRYDLYSFADDYGETAPNTAAYDYYGWVHPKDWVTVGLGGCARVDKGAAAPAPQYGTLKFFDPDGGGVLNTSTYDFIEAALQRAYNYIAVPVLNRDVRPNIRKLCGIEYDSKYWNKTRRNATTGKDEPNPDYLPDYDGDLPSDFYTDPPTNAQLNVDKYPYLKIFDFDVKAPKIQVPQGTTLVEYMNTMLGEVCNAALATKLPDGHPTSGTVTSAVVKAYDKETDASWTWNYGTDGKGNQYLFQNIASVAKFVVAVSGDLLFGDVYLEAGTDATKTAGKEIFPAADNLIHWGDQAIVSFVLRSLLNAFVDWMYIGPTYDTVAKVLYRACEQLAWQDMPERTYPNMPETTDAVIDAALNILMDEAVYGLNQGFDMLQNDLATNRGNDPEARAGLLQYLGDGETYEDRLAQIVDWAVSKYGKLTHLDLNYKRVVRNDDGSIQSVNGETTGFGDKAWEDLNTIINAVIPINGNEKPWLFYEIGSVKSLLLDYILIPICNLDGNQFQKIFWKNDIQHPGELFDSNLETNVIRLISRVVNLLIPGAFRTAETIDGLINSPGSSGSLLGDTVFDLIGGLSATNGRGLDLIEAAFPILCYVLKLNRDQEFKEMEIYINGTLPSESNKDAGFQIYNGSSGLNTAHTKKRGESNQFIHDKLYEYEITGVSVKGYMAGGSAALTDLSLDGVSEGDKLAGGELKEVKITGNRQDGELAVIKISYKALGEDGTSMLKDAGGVNDISLSKTAYCYLGTADKDDDEAYVKVENTLNGRKIQYNQSIYLTKGRSLGKIEDYGVSVIDKTASGASEPFGNVKIALAADSSHPAFVAGNTDTPTTNNNRNAGPQELKLNGAYHFLYPFKAAVDPGSATGEIYERKVPVYQKDENGNVKYDEDYGLPVPVDPPQFEGTVEDGAYEAKSTITATEADASVTTYDITTYIHLYNDFGLPGLFEDCVARNRQLGDYGASTAANAAYDAYVAALNTAARLVLTPKKGASFASDIATTAVNPHTNQQYVNKYHQYYIELKDAIKALEEYAQGSATSDLEALILTYSGKNFKENAPYSHTCLDGTVVNNIISTTDLEYNDPDYVYFGIRDKVPHTYRKYRDAKSKAEKLIYSHKFYGPAQKDFAHDLYSQSERKDFDEAVKEYKKNVENAAVIDAAKVAYAKHMLELTGGRLIALEPNKGKLADAINEYGRYDRDALAACSFSDETINAYIDAKTFAEAKNTNGTKPSEINAAYSNLVHCWKNLAKGADYSQLQAAVDAAERALAEAGYSYPSNGVPPYPGDQSQTYYTAPTYKLFYDAYFDAKRLYTDEDKLSGNDRNQRRIDRMAASLDAATRELETAASGPFGIRLIEEPSWPFDEAPKLDGCYIVGDDPYWDAPTLNGRPVDNFILNWNEGITEDFAKECVANLDEVDVEVESSSEYGNCGTGTLFKVYRKNQLGTPGAEMKLYQVTFFGDVNGDDEVSSLDAGIISEQSRSAEWEYDADKGYLFRSGDVTGDGTITLEDAALVETVSAYNGKIDQSMDYVEYSRWIF